VKRTFALTESEEFDDVARKLGVDVSVPMRGTVVDSIMSHLRGRNVTSVHTVNDGRFEIVGCDVAPGSPACGKALKELSRPGEYLLLLVRKAADGSFSLPRGDTVLGAGDHVNFIAKTGDGSIVRLFAQEGAGK
jgi:trk system potassium uptake protein TrkA